MEENLSIFDLLLTPIYLFVIWIIARKIREKNIRDKPEYKYFVTGLFVKILGAFALGFVYFFYYEGGDTVNYFVSARAYLNLATVNSSDFLEGWFGNPPISSEWFYFSQDTGFPVYYHRDSHSFFVVRLLIPIVFLGAKTYFSSAVLTAALTFTGIWKLYKTFLAEFPSLSKELAIAIIFIPSCVFWGSGIMKDSFTLSAIGWYTYS